MDQIALVDKQIEAGQKVLEALFQEAVPVTAACWLKESESGRWFCYLITPLVGEDGATRAAYHRVFPVIRRLRDAGFWIDTMEVKVIGPTAPIAQAVAEFQRQHPGSLRGRHGGYSLARLDIDDAYIYPSIAVVSQ
jgi:hypothetical protein